MWFHIQGAGRLLTRRKGPVTRMILVALVGTVWCLAGGALGLSVWRDIDRRAGEMIVDVVMQHHTTDAEIRSIVADLRRRPSVARADYLSSEQVWKNFSQELKLESDDLREVAAVPRIIRLRLQSRIVSVSKTVVFIRSVQDTYPESIDRIVWPRAFAEMIDSSRRDVIGFGGVAGTLSLILFLLAVAYAFRAEIHRAGADLSVAALLGATPGWIAAPHIIVGGVCGLVGLVFGVTLVVIAREIGSASAPWISSVSAVEILVGALLIAMLGLLMTWWQSIISVRRIARRR